MPSIEGASIRSILDSRGNPTIEVEIRSGRALGRAAAPSGASTGTHEPPAWPRGGVDEAIRTFRDSVAPRLKGRDVADQAGLDRTLHEVDGTANFARIGANVATAASLANAKAAASSSGKPLYRYLGGAPRPTLPLRFGNVIGGGRHAVGGTTIQEYLVLSQGPTLRGNGFANARVHRLVRGYHLFSVEDPFDEEDFGAFAELTKRVGAHCKVIGDDIFVTNVERLRLGIESHAANAILIKPNQIGTLSDTRAAVELAHRSGYATVMSHRSGETTDDTIAHLAVAFGCLGIKTGSVGGERIAKLNELIRIEEELQAGA